MSQEPPLPYAGAITLKNLLENPLFANDPTQIAMIDKKKDQDDQTQINSMLRNSAILGNSLWDASSIIPYSDINDFKVELLDNEDFWNELNAFSGGGDGAPVDLSEYIEPGSLSTKTENSLDMCVSPKPVSTPTSPIAARGSPTLANALVASPPRSPGSGPGSPMNSNVVYENFSPEALVLASVPGEGLFNPGKRKFNIDELKPQPVIKKSRKTFVPEDLKDDRYWARRRKNNTAAKRSRDAKRIKENQIALRAGFLEEENDLLKKELAKVKSENKSLRARLESYEPL